MKIEQLLSACVVVALAVTAAPILGGQNAPPVRSTPSQVERVDTSALPQAQQPATGEQIKWQVIAGGGSRGTSTSYVLSGTVGQTAVGSGTSTSYKVNQGFWQNFGSPPPVCTNCGDANSDNSINISDAVYLIQYIFAGGAAPNPLCKGDANGDSSVNISDAVYLIQYIFAGGAPPHCP